MLSLLGEDFDMNQFSYCVLQLPLLLYFCIPIGRNKEENMASEDYLVLHFAAGSNLGPHRNCRLNLDEQRTQVLLLQPFSKCDIAHVTGLYSMDFSFPGR